MSIVHPEQQQAKANEAKARAENDPPQRPEAPKAALPAYLMPDRNRCRSPGNGIQPGILPAVMAGSMADPKTIHKQKKDLADSSQ